LPQAYLIFLSLVLHCRSSDLEVFVVKMMLTSYAAVAVVCDAVPDAVPNELELSELYKLHVIYK
jgi:hypothetical protein